ncbi:hypothetical protein JCM10449v2_004627 [Rhodotorula kratochvilovae]
MLPISSPNAPKAAPFLSPAILSGNTLYLSGQCGVDPESGAFIDGTVADRTRRAMANIEALLQAAGMNLGDIVSVQIFLSEYVRDFEAMNEAYIQVFEGYSPMPARYCVGVAALPKGTDVEISCIAVKRSESNL